MYEGESVYSIIWNTFPNVPLDNIFLSVFSLYCLQVEWCTMVDFLYICMDWYLGLIEDL